MVPARAATIAPKSPMRRQREPGSRETNPSGVSSGAGERGAFARREPCRQMGQANQTGRVEAGERMPPPWLYIKQAPSLLLSHIVPTNAMDLVLQGVVTMDKFAAESHRSNQSHGSHVARSCDHGQIVHMRRS